MLLILNLLRECKNQYIQNLQHDIPFETGDYYS